METAVDLGRELDNQALACRALLVAQATLYRHRRILKRAGENA